ncbi:MAG: hypothetical protein K8R45_10180 [Desulfobacterales bacterium]|nr:hypothetical protein [Desulfobacterales bacterium]
MKYGEDFIRAYRVFRESVDFSTGGILPELDSLTWCMLAGVPEVPADEDTSPDAPVIAIYQRVAILKAVFVEVNGDQPEEFIDQGLIRYDRASEMAKKLLKEEVNLEPDLE